MAQSLKIRALRNAARMGVTPKQFEAQVRQGLKPCYRCRRFRVRAAFGKHARRHDGLRIYCKPCRKQREFEQLIRARLEVKNA